METVSRWDISPKSVNLICQAIAPEGSPDLPEYNFRAELGPVERSGPWRVCRVAQGHWHFSVFLYRKRAIVSWEIDATERRQFGRDNLADSSAIDHFVRFYLSDLKDDMLAVLQTAIDAESVRWRTMPLLVADLKMTRSHKQLWQSDGITSFYMRLYDSSKGRPGFVRVSHHVVLCAGIGGRLQQDIVNLVYEKFLYAPEVNRECEADFLDGLARYVVPAELNIFLQEAIARLTLIALITAFILATLALFASKFDVGEKVLMTGVSIIVVIGVWILAQRVRLLRWE